jgi:hypothetical protein
MKVVLAFLLAAIGAGASAGSIGTVADTKGTACSIERNKKEVAGSKGSAVESMDTYITKKCESNITFIDDTRVKVTENSRLVIDDFVFDPKQSDAGKLAMRVGMGTVRYASGQIAKQNPQRVAITTPTANIAVRGTDFSMTVDETGQSLIMLLPSCKDDKDIKTYEMEEQRCRVGAIVVETNAGKVELTEAFQATYVISANAVPSLPVVVNTVEAKINNLLILSQPHEVAKAIRDTTGKTKKEEEDAEIELEAQRRLAQRVREAQQAIEDARLLALLEAAGAPACNPGRTVCVRWDQPNEADIQSRGKGIAYRETVNEHYAEVKTQGYSSNTTVTIVHDDSPSTVVIGDGSAGGNMVYIKQNNGVLKQRMP